MPDDQIEPHETLFNIMFFNFPLLMDFIPTNFRQSEQLSSQLNFLTGFDEGLLNLLIYAGLGFVTSISFIFLVGIFMSSWLGASVLTLGEWFIKKMPFVSYIYAASKQISTAISPGNNQSYTFKS